MSKEDKVLMFEGLNSKIFDDPEFKEDSVREEIIVPILKRLGYSAVGSNKIIRSKALLHPFVMIGSKKHPVNIVPDYLLFSEGKPGWVLDAKRPNTNLIKSKHAEQAYSYAIHPEVRVRFYALCNGQQFVIYDIYMIAPVLTIDFDNIDSQWQAIESILCPQNVAFAPERYFDPDFGLAIVKMGAEIGSQWCFPFAKLSQFICVSEGLYTMGVAFKLAEVVHLASFDAESNTLNQILGLTSEENRKTIRALGPQQSVCLQSPIYLSVETEIGEPTQGQHDVFIPFIIKTIQPMEESIYLEMEVD